VAKTSRKRMTKLYAENILIGSQWQSDQTLILDSSGTITEIVEGKDADATSLNGPVIPGMPNCHSHAFQRAFAGYSEYRQYDANGEPTTDSFWSWRDIMYRFVAKMSPEDLHVVAKFLYIEMLKAGYTSVAEFHYLHHQVGNVQYDDPAEMSHQVIKAAELAGIGMTHLPVLYTYAGFGEQAPSSAQGRFIHQTNDYLRLLESLHSSYSGTASFKLGIAPHSLRAASEEQLKQVIPFIRDMDSTAPIHIHIAEQTKEVEDCLDFYNQRPVEWLLNEQQVDQHWCLIHATHLSNSEVNELAKSGSIAGICPTTEANLGDGIFPTQEFLELGGRFAIGSDSHIAINIADELRLLEYGQRLTSHQRAVLVNKACPSVGQYLYLKAAADGAKALSQNIGEINVGKRADLVVLDPEHPSLFSKQNSQILDAAIFACNQLPVKDVFVAGKQVIENGDHLACEEAVKGYKKVLVRIV
jgi:formimidoylglutamate deiminase